MAHLGSGDRPLDVTEGASEGQQDSVAPGARERGRTAEARLDGAARRDQLARTRDLAALARDRAADARKLAMEQLDAASQQDDDARTLSGADVIIRAAGQRKRAAHRRAQAAAQRELASEDRLDAARDREQAARERLRSLVDREALARELAGSETDSLTGARTRAAGLLDLEHELARCRRTGAALVVAYVEVVGLLDDSEGQGAGDALLKRVVGLIKAHLRPYDLVIRLGDDEILCAISNMGSQDARRRLHAIAEALGAAPYHGAISAGFAELGPDETVAELIARAAGELG